MAKTTTEKLETAKKKLAGQKSDPAAGAKLRAARKKVKRLQRRSRSEKVRGAKVAAQTANQQKKQQEAEEKAAKKKAAQEASLNAAAERQAQADSAASQEG